MKSEVCVRIYTRDGDLRAWLVDELALMSPTIDVHATDVLDAATAQLLIVSTDALTLADVDVLRALAIPVIAIGPVPPQFSTIPFACVLDLKLTSKQFKRAVRDCFNTFQSLSMRAVSEHT
jgi:hypothetical protein